MPDTRMSIDLDNLDQRITAAVRKVMMSEEFNDRLKKVIHDELDARLQKMDDTMTKLGDLHTKVTDLQDSIRFTSDRLESLVKHTIPAFSEHVSKGKRKFGRTFGASKSSNRHPRRKWNQIEGCGNTEHFRLSACHRLSRKPDAGIILRFCDLVERDK